MIPTAVPLAINYGMARASVASGGSLINLYPQPAPPGARADTVLIGSPGTRQFCQLRQLVEGGEIPDTNVNALLFAFGKIVVVTDNAVYLVGRDGKWARRGDAGLSGEVSIAFNRTDVAAVNGTGGLWINESESVPIAGTGWYPADAVTFLDSYLIFNRAGTGQVFQTGAYTRAFDPLDLADAEKSPDNTTGVLAVGDNLYLFGETTTEVWYNAGNIRFAFSRIAGATMEQGLAGVATARTYDSTAFWLTAGGLVMMGGPSGGAQRISDDQVEAALKDRRAHWDRARAFVYTDEGHIFYVLTVGDITLAYDVTMDAWHQRANYSRGHALGRCYVQAWDGRHFIGDDRGRILEMRGDLYDDAGEPLIAEVLTVPYTNARQISAVGSLELEMDTGLSPLGGDYSVRLSASEDGVTWTPERGQSIGRTGMREKVIQWRKLGARRVHRFRLRISDPFRRAILSQAWMRL